MAMSGFEKLFVNRESKGRKNVRKMEERLRKLDVASIHDVLEIGCGIGSVSAYLAENYGMQVTGTDLDPAQVQAAQRLYGERTTLDLRVEDAVDLSFADDSFDLVISHNVFHHIQHWEQAVAEIARVLRPNGHLIWQDIVFSAPIRGLLGRVVHDASFYSVDEVMQAFDGSGFVPEFHERMALLALTQHHIVWRCN